MEFSSIVIGGILGLFVWYMISVTRAYNRNKKQLANHGPDQVVKSMLRLMNDKVDMTALQFIPETMSDVVTVPLLNDVLDGIRDVFDRWADVREFDSFNISIAHKGSLIHALGQRSHFVITVVYQCDAKPPVVTDLQLSVNRLGRYQLYQETCFDILTLMYNAK